MSAAAQSFTDAPRPGWWPWLRRELTYASGREITTVWMAVAVVLVTIISMFLEVPEAAISAYMVFFITKENRVLTMLTSTLLILGVTVSIGASLLLYRYTFDYPALRIPVMAVAIFAGMYLSRVFVVGPLGFITGFVVALTQSTAENIPDTETLARLALDLGGARLPRRADRRDQPDSLARRTVGGFHARTGPPTRRRRPWPGQRGWRGPADAGTSPCWNSPRAAARR